MSQDFRNIFAWWFCLEVAVKMLVYSDLKTLLEEDQFLSLLAGLLARSFISLLVIERKIRFLITWSYPWAASVSSPHGSRLPPKQVSQEKRQRGSHNAFYHLFSEFTVLHFCCILFARSDLISCVHTQGEGRSIKEVKTSQSLTPTWSPQNQPKGILIRAMLS